MARNRSWLIGRGSHPFSLSLGSSLPHPSPPPYQFFALPHFSHAKLSSHRVQVRPTVRLNTLHSRSSICSSEWSILISYFVPGFSPGSPSGATLLSCRSLHSRPMPTGLTLGLPLFGNCFVRQEHFREVSPFDYPDGFRPSPPGAVFCPFHASPGSAPSPLYPPNPDFETFVFAGFFFFFHRCQTKVPGTRRYVSSSRRVGV